MKRQVNIPQMVRDVLGKPYQRRGRGPDGFNCYGLYYYCATEYFGLDVPAYSAAMVLDGDREAVAVAVADRLGEWTQVGRVYAEPGDAVRLLVAGYDHVGVYLGGKEFLHILKGKNVSTAKFTDGEWEKRFKGIFRYVGT